MKAIVLESFGGANVLQVTERAIPTLKPNEVLIQVKASGINRPDVFQRKGHYPAPEGVVSDILGLEIAGIVAEVGAEVSRWQVGDAVCALLAGGGYAEFAVADAWHCLPKPENLDFAEAACLPETVYTVWHNLFQRGGLSRGDRVLIHGGSGGIGSTAIQLASLFSEAVYTTAGADERCRQCEQLGALLAINYHKQDFTDVLKDARISLVLDAIGGDYFRKNVELIEPDGRIVYINAVKGADVALNLGLLMRKRLTLSGSTLRSRDTAFKAALTMEVEKNVWPLIAKRQFKPIVQQRYAYDQVVQAHTRMEIDRPFGKIALEW